MIEQLLDAAEATVDTSCTGGDCKRREFIDEWVPRLVTEIERLQKEVADLRQLCAMQETQLLEADSKEAEDV